MNDVRAQGDNRAGSAVPLRICLISGEYPPRVGGVADYTSCLANALHRQGHTVMVLTSAGGTAPDQEWEVRRAITRWDRAVGQVAAALGDEHWDVFNLQYVPHLYHRLGICPTTAGLALALRRRGRVVTTLHELYRPWSRRPAQSALAALQRLQFALLLLGSHRLAVTTAPRLRQVRRIAPWQVVDLIPVGATITPQSGGETAHAARSALAAEQDLLIGSFGTTFTGHDTYALLTALARVPSAVLLLLGAITPGVYERLQRSALALGVRERLRYTGYLPAEALSAHLAALDGYVHTQDVGATPRSTTLATALAHELPVVAQRGPDTDARYQDGENILLVPQGDAQALATALERLHDPKLRARLRAGARQLYRQDLAWSTIARAFLALYRPASIV